MNEKVVATRRKRATKPHRLTEDEADYPVSVQREKEPTVSLKTIVRDIERRLGRPLNRKNF